MHRCNRKEKMTVKIKISYERKEELQHVIDKLGGDVKRIKEPRQPKEKRHTAYIELK